MTCSISLFLIHIVNMDQTIYHFDMAPAYTNNVRGEKMIRIKTTRAEKKGLIHSGSGSNSRWVKTSSHNHLQ